MVWIGTLVEFKACIPGISHTITGKFLSSKRDCFHKIAAHTHWKHYISACPKGLKHSDIDNNKQSSTLHKQVCFLPALAEPQNGLTWHWAIYIQHRISLLPKYSEGNCRGKRLTLCLSVLSSFLSLWHPMSHALHFTSYAKWGRVQCKKKKPQRQADALWSPGWCYPDAGFHCESLSCHKQVQIPSTAQLDQFQCFTW